MTQSNAREKGQAEERERDSERERGRRGRAGRWKGKVAVRLHLAFYCQGAQILSKDFELAELELGRICILQRKRQQDMRKDADNGTRVETCRCLGAGTEAETRGPVAILFLFAPALQVSLSECRAVAAGAAQAAEALVGIYKYIFRFA